MERQVPSHESQRPPSEQQPLQYRSFARTIVTNKSHPLSRRDFVATTTLGAVALWRGSAFAASVPSRAADPLMYVGSYTENGRRDGIFLVRMNSATGALQQVGAVDGGPNPSFLTLHPNGRMLYVVNETTETEGRPTGAVGSYSIDADSGALTFFNEQASQGGAPCYVSTDRKGRVAFVANYVSGTLAVLPIANDGGLERAPQVVQHVGTGPVTGRQESAHAHCVVPHPNNRFVFAADLGADRVLVYRFDEANNTLQHMDRSDAVMPPGAGPRHLAFHPTMPFVFVANELDSTVGVLSCDPDTGALSLARTASTLPARWSGTNFPADIHVAADGRTLYVSNRGHNSIAVFSVAPRTAALAQVQVISTGGDWPRNFTLDPTGRWLLVANQRSGGVTVFSRNAMSGALTATSQRIELPSPVCLRFQSAT
jgi:6-phosphogluconolactonase